MKKLLTFGFIFIICFIATPVLADGEYKGSCWCDDGYALPYMGTCNAQTGCYCRVPSHEITTNNCVKEESSTEESSTDNNKYKTGTCECQYGNWIFSGTCNSNYQCNCNGKGSVLSNNCKIVDNDNNNQNTADDRYSGSCWCTDKKHRQPGICDPIKGCTCTNPYEIESATNKCLLSSEILGNSGSGNSGSGNINVGQSNVDCGVISDITRPAARIILIAAPIILLIMGAVDILGVVTSGDEKGMKKAWSNLVKRFIICVAIFLLPLIINFIIGWTTFKDLSACL